MAAVSRPRPAALRHPASRPVAPHPGLEIDLEPQLPGIVAAPPAQQLTLGILLALESARLGRVAFAVASLGAFLGIGVVYVMSMTGNLSTEGDNAIYIILAKALATGHGYMNIQDPVPRIESQFPFLFPLLLTPVVKFWGTWSVLQMQAVVTAFAMGSFAMSFVLFRRLTGSAVLAVAICLATAFSDLVWSFSHKVLTEIPYLFFTLLACWLASRYTGQDRWRTWTGVLAALAVVAAFLTRTIGLSLCLALPLSLLFAPPLRIRDAQWRLRLCKAGLVTIILLLLAGGWTLRNRLVYSGQGHNYTGQFMLRQTYVPDAGSISLNIKDLTTRATGAIQYYGGVYQRMIAGHIWDHVPARGGVSQALLLITILGFVYAFVRRRSLAEWYVLGYVCVVLLWPWTDLRFAVPLLPFMIYYLANALLLPMLVLARLRPIDPRIAAAMILLPLAVPTGIHTLHTAMNDRKVGYHYEIERLGEWEAYSDWRDFRAVATCLTTIAPPNSVIINRSPNLLYLWTGMYSRNYPYRLDKSYMLRDISKEHRDYVIVDAFQWTYTTGLYLVPVLHAYPDQFFGPLCRSHQTVAYQVY